MSFRNESYASIFPSKQESKSDKYRTVSVTTSRKDKDGYITDFSGFCNLLGKANSDFQEYLDAMSDDDYKSYSDGKKPVRVLLKSVEVTTSKVKDKFYNNFKVWEMEIQKSESEKPKSRR